MKQLRSRVLLEGKDAEKWLVCCMGASQGPATCSATEAAPHPHSEKQVQVGAELLSHVLRTKTESRILGGQKPTSGPMGRC